MAAFVVVGAGAIGGAVGARLVEAGHAVTFVARGAHARVMARDGLTLVEPDRVLVQPVAVVTRLEDAPLADADALLLSVKSQDTAPVVQELAAVAPASIAIACFQNGVVNERLVAAHFDRVHGVVVMMPALHLEPGRVVAFASPIPGLFDVGLAAGGVDDTVGTLVRALGEAGFDARAVPDVMRWKHTKLLMNLGNAVEAMCGLDEAAIELVDRARREGVAVLDAAGVAYASREEERARRGELLQVRAVEGQPRGGGSSWQSLARGLGSIEADAFNGEVVRLGVIADVPTPVNALILERALAAATARIPPGSVPASELLAELA